MIGSLLITASLTSWWSGFCERHLIADSPAMVIKKQGLKASPEQAEYLIRLYREVGSKAYYGDKLAAKELGWLGDELRAYDIGQDAIEDYWRYEK